LFKDSSVDLDLQLDSPNIGTKVLNNSNNDNTGASIKRSENEKKVSMPSHELLRNTRIDDHAAMRLDFKGEAFTFKATTSGILHDLSHCVEIMRQREEFLNKKLEREIDKRRRAEEQYRQLLKSKKNTIIVNGPDFEEGPHSTIKEEQFFDAIDSTLDTLELEEERVI
jgi:hypothetical protein